ncbi:MAG: Serine/threonine phosphatase stp [Deltaproteobacteria bacterium ADurb.Bin058]|nr:MAG: Serine/threonine phosphatase stp [Deltaproteobacteria bacterium ADurb.Bin058]
MRVEPTQEQVGYLASIGASRSSTPQPRPREFYTSNNQATSSSDASIGGQVERQPANAPTTSFKTSKTQALPWLAAILLLAALSLVLAHKASAQQLESKPGVSMVENDFFQYVPRDGYTVFTSDLVYDNPTNVQLRSQDQYMEIGALRNELAALRQSIARLLVGFSAITILGISLVIIGRIQLRRGIRQMKQNDILKPSETDPNLQDDQNPTELKEDSQQIIQIEKNSPDPQTEENCETLPQTEVGEAKQIQTQDENQQPALAADEEGDKSPRKVSTDEVTDTMPPPSQTAVEEFGAIIAEAELAAKIRVKPTLPSARWELGLATAKGNVRSENQDYGLCFKINGYDVLIVADGCGGLPHGRQASHLAVVSAAVSVIQAYGAGYEWYRPHPKDVALRAIIDAERRLSVEGEKLQIKRSYDGLRTTLIVVIGTQHEFGVAYIGDGGGCIISTNGLVNNFLKPQRPNGVPNVISASLGPVIEGEPMSDLIPRQKGDLLIVGTDGVFDHCIKNFPKNVLRHCLLNWGNLQEATEQVLDSFASAEDQNGYIFDDNMTLGLMGDGLAPKLCQGFWEPTEATHQEAV